MLVKRTLKLVDLTGFLRRFNTFCVSTVLLWFYLSVSVHTVVVCFANT